MPRKKPQAIAPEITPATKAGRIIDLLRRPEGASVAELMQATGWQADSVRGCLSGAVRKALGAKVSSEVVEGVHRYKAPAL